MSSTIPEFHEGDLVRAMDTTDNQKRGIASQIGVVAGLHPLSLPAGVFVDLPGGRETISAASLSHVHLPHIGTWLHNWKVRAEVAEAKVTELKAKAEEVRKAADLEAYRRYCGR